VAATIKCPHAPLQSLRRRLEYGLVCAWRTGSVTLTKTHEIVAYATLERISCRGSALTSRPITLISLLKMATPLSAVRFKLVFRVPTTGLAACKAAIFSAGAGRYPDGLYTECCWSVIGTGQFRPGELANPHIGKPGELEEVQEARVETLCVGEDVARNAVKALKE
jgi:hypothetical protein